MNNAIKAKVYFVQPECLCASEVVAIRLNRKLNRASLVTYVSIIQVILGFIFFKVLNLMVSQSKKAIKYKEVKGKVWQF